MFYLQDLKFRNNNNMNNIYSAYYKVSKRFTLWFNSKYNNIEINIQ